MFQTLIKELETCILLNIKERFYFIVVSYFDNINFLNFLNLNVSIGINIRMVPILQKANSLYEALKDNDKSKDYY